MMKRLHPINWPVSGDIPETIECPTCGTICRYTIEERIEEKRKNKEPLSDDEAASILEDVLDTLIEVGNGITDEHLHESADDLLQFRDYWFNLNRGD